MPTRHRRQWGTCMAAVAQLDGHSALVTTLASYVPDVVVRRLARDPRPLIAPLAQKYAGAALIADVSGFTAIAESLAKQGARGAETLNGMLNDYFGRAIAVISACGGDVVRFAGDALLAVWYADSADGIAESTARTVHCALTLQAELHGYQTREGLPLSLKVGVGAGEFVGMHVGGVLDRWELLFSGPAFAQAFAAMGSAAAGDVVASLRAWSHVKEQCTGRQLSMGSVLVERRTTAVEPRAAPLPELSDEMALGLHAYIPAAVTSCLLAGQENWLGELRVASALFVNLPELNYATPLDRAQQIVRVPANRTLPLRRQPQQAERRREGHVAAGRDGPAAAGPRRRRQAGRAGRAGHATQAGRTGPPPVHRHFHRPRVLRLDRQRAAPRIHAAGRRGQRLRAAHAGGRRRHPLRRSHLPHGPRAHGLRALYRHRHQGPHGARGRVPPAGKPPHRARRSGANWSAAAANAKRSTPASRPSWPARKPPSPSWKARRASASRGSWPTQSRRPAPPA